MLLNHTVTLTYRTQKLLVFFVLFCDLFQFVQKLERVGDVGHVVVLSQVEPGVSANKESGHEVEQAHYLVIISLK